jgi:hypothetical protein
MEAFRMAAGDQKGPERWSTSVPEKVARPRGRPECFRSAVGRLGPFKSQTQKQAQVQGPWSLDGRTPLSEELAREQVFSLAHHFNVAEYLNKGASRYKDVVDRLLKLEELSGELARFLESLDDITRYRLHTMGIGVGRPEDYRHYEIVQAANVEGLPAPSGASTPDTGESWVAKLKALSEYTNVALDYFLLSSGIESVDAVDKGGSTNPHKHFAGSARWSLVSQGWYIFDLFKPGGATGTEGGPFHLFLQEVFEFATGLDPEQESKLSSLLKTQAKASRRYKEVSEELIRFEREQKEAWRRDPLAWNEKMGEAHAKRMMQLLRERQELWERLYPHTYGSPKKGDVPGSGSEGSQPD